MSIEPKRCPTCHSAVSFDGVQRSGTDDLGHECGTCSCGQSRMFELPSDPLERIARLSVIACRVAEREDIAGPVRARLVGEVVEEILDAGRVLRGRS